MDLTSQRDTAMSDTTNRDLVLKDRLQPTASAEPARGSELLGVFLRSKVWREGWRNLHHPKAAVAADFALEGEKLGCTVAREWPDEAALDAATTWAQLKGKPRAGQLHHTWAALSRACHHHPYELAPTAGESEAHFGVIEAFREGLTERQA